jgi:hypothetical protein
MGIDRLTDASLLKLYENIRQQVLGCKGWMVYDRQRKGPAMVGTSLVVNLTRERANHIAHGLTAESQDKSNYPSHPH